MKRFEQLLERFGVAEGALSGGVEVRRVLSQLDGCFHDEGAYERMLGEGDPLIYRVTAVERGSGSGDLHYGLGVLYPGKVGDEYYLTKGHYHENREAAEVYIGLAGEGRMLLEDEASGESVLLPFGRERVVYVPGHTAHRTINTGREPLIYFGIYPANAGHDYGAIAVNNFRYIVVEENGEPRLRERSK
jgi:glucose-6-phosphate isomerase